MVIWKGTSKATYHFPKKCNIFFTFSGKDWDKLRKNPRTFCHMRTRFSACACLLDVLCLYSSPSLFLLFFHFIHLSRFVLSFLFLSFLPFYLSVCHPLPLLFSLSFTVKQSTDITWNNKSPKNIAHVHFISATLVQHSPRVSYAL